MVSLAVPVAFMVIVFPPPGCGGEASALPRRSAPKAPTTTDAIANRFIVFTSL
jgi:hypothetical protein